VGTNPLPQSSISASGLWMLKNSSPVQVFLELKSSECWDFPLPML
jgi:hypothetical protein